jgi:hypothetical protein
LQLVIAIDVLPSAKPVENSDVFADKVVVRLTEEERTDFGGMTFRHLSNCGSSRKIKVSEAAPPNIGR